MSEYIFRFPAGCPNLDFESLQRLLWPATHVHRIGTTVTVTGRTRDPVPGITFSLYDTTIAIIRRDRVEFPVTRDAHMATGEWLGKIIRDNGIGSGCGRVRRHASDPLVPGPRGYMGPLCIGYDRLRPVEGHAYPVGQPGAEPWCNHDGPDAIPGRRCECGMTVPPDSDYSRRRRAELAAAVRAARS